MQKYNKKFIRTLYNTIKECQSSYSYVLMDEQKVFATFKALQFAELAKGQTFDVLVEKVNLIKGNKKKIDLLKVRYQGY